VRGKKHTGYWLENVRVRDQSEDLGVEERIILKRIFKKYERSVDGIDLAQ
jgi:hypothetical protein